MIDLNHPPKHLVKHTMSIKETLEKAMLCSGMLTETGAPFHTSDLFGLVIALSLVISGFLFAAFHLSVDVLRAFQLLHMR